SYLATFDLARTIGDISRASIITFFFSSRRRHTRWPRDWSSDVCSSDLAAGPSPAPPSPWHPAHHFTYTAFPFVVSCMGTRDGGRGTGTKSASASRASIMPRPPSRVPRPRFLPRPRRPPSLIVQEQDHRPDLALGEEILPLGHRRVPRRAFARQPGPPLGHAPEHEALRELRDGAVVLEVGREGIEAGGEVPLTVEVVPVTRQAVPIVDVLAQREVGRERVGVGAQRVLETRERDRFAADRDLGGRRRMNGAKIGRRRDGRGHLSVRDEPDEHRHHHEQYAADHPQ